MIKSGTHGLVKSFLKKWSSAIYPVGKEDIYVTLIHYRAHGILLDSVSNDSDYIALDLYHNR